MDASEARGDLRISRPSGGSTPRVMAGGPSAMRLTHSTWIGENGTGRARRLAPRMVAMAPRFVDSWNRTNFTMLA